MLFGQDFLFGSFYLQALLAASRSGDCAGIFLNTPRRQHKTLNKMLRSKLYSEIVVHVCPFDYSHEYPIRELRKLCIAETKFLQKKAKRFKSTKILISLFCEHNHARRNIEPLINKCKTLAPDCEFVNSIWKGEPVPGTIAEIHITSSKNLPRPPQGQYTISFDGFGGDGTGDSPDCDIGRIINHYPDARQIRIWNFRHNGKFGHLDHTPQDKRENWPTVQYLKGHRALLDPRQGRVTWPSSALYKPFADDHGKDGSSKDNKAMAILPVRLPAVKVYDSKGNTIDLMQRFPGDHPLGARYYSKLYAFQLGNIAERNTGSRLIRIDSMPLTDANLRSGLFK